MTRHQIAIGAGLCVVLAALAIADVVLDWRRDVGDATSSVERDVSAAPGPGSAPAPPPSVARTPAEQPGRTEGTLQVLVMHAGTRQGGAEVRAYLRSRPEGHAPAARWRLAAAATTGADGVAALAVAPGTYLVAARAPALAPGHAAVVRPIGETVTRMAIALVDRVAVAGRVVTRGSGEPVPLADVALCREGLRALSAEPLPVEECARAVADPSGRFSLAVAPGPHVLEASATGFTRARIRLTAPAVAEVPLAAGAVVEGVVLKPDGAPAGGAEVMLAGGEEVVRAAAGASGGFAVEVVPGTYSVKARSERAAGAWPVPVTVAAGGRARGLLIRLGDGGGIAGVVTGADGAPVPGASVTVSSHGTAGALAPAESDERGRFALEPLPAGTYDVAVIADGWTPASRHGIALLAGERVEVAIALTRQGGIEGLVRDGAGRAVAGARVGAGRRTWAGPGSAEAVVRTDEAGRFRLDGLAAGRNEVAAARDDAATGVIAAVDVAPGTMTTVDLTLPETGKAEGVVLRRDRSPVGRAVVLVRSRAPPAVSARVEVDRDGAWAVQLPAGDYDALAAPLEDAGPGVRQRPAMLRVFPGQESRLELYLDGPTGAATAPAVVQVLEPDGSGSPGALVLVTAGDDLRRAGSALTDEGGLARVELTERGTLLVRALRAGRSGGPVPLATSGPTVVTLRAPAQLRGRVIAAEGPPVAGFKLELAALGDDVSVVSTMGGAAAMKDARGVQAPLRLEFSGDRFEIADAPAGPLRIGAQTPGGRYGQAQLTAAPGEVREVDVLLAPGAAVEGRALDARNGAPVAGAAVIVVNDGAAPSRAEATTGPDGRFRLTGLPAGAPRLRLVAPGYAPAERAAELAAAGTVDLGDVALAIAPAAATR